jgi:hypothetical protein
VKFRFFVRQVIHLYSRNDRFLENAHPFHRGTPRLHQHLYRHEALPLILFTRSVLLLFDTCVSLTSKYRYYLIATEYENVAKSSTLETNSIVSFFNKLGSIDEIRSLSIPSTSSKAWTNSRKVCSCFFYSFAFAIIHINSGKNDFLDVLLRYFGSIFQHILIHLNAIYQQRNGTIGTFIVANRLALLKML